MSSSENIANQLNDPIAAERLLTQLIGRLATNPSLLAGILDANGLSGPSAEFIQTSVTRRATEVQLPSKIWTFKVMRKWQENSIQTCFVRQEYHDSLVAILRWLKAGSTEPIKVVPDNCVFDESLDQYPNPFQVAQGEKYHGKNLGLVIVGMPGIGKSIFLYYIWNLRRALNLPTLLLNEDGELVMWTNNTFRKAALTNTLEDHFRDVPEGTWCLVDSGSTTKDVPSILYGFTFFIIQAASSRVERLRWITKRDSWVEHFTMRDWSAQELVLGCNLQRLDSAPPEENLIQFHKSFGGSARDAYKFALRLQTYADGLEEAIRSLNTSLLTESLPGVPTTVINVQPHIDPDYSHRIISVFPFDDGDRKNFVARTPTPEILELLFSTLSRRNELSKAELFDFLTDATPRATVAGHYYDYRFHEFLLQETTLSARPMNPVQMERYDGRKTRLWKSSDEVTMLCNFTLKGFKEYRFDANKPPTAWQTNGYYIPSNHSFPTLDSFFVMSSTHIVGFQATVSSHHGLSISGLEWLKKQGFETMEYVYVSPSRVGTASVPFPAYIPDSLSYHDLDPNDYPTMLLPAHGSSLPAGTVSSNMLKILSVHHLHLDIRVLPDESKTPPAPAPLGKKSQSRPTPSGSVARKRRKNQSRN